MFTFTVYLCVCPKGISNNSYRKLSPELVKQVVWLFGFCIILASSIIDVVLKQRISLMPVKEDKAMLYYHLFHMYSTALMQCRTHTTLFLNSTGLLEQSAFAILEKITRVANDTLSSSFYEYQLLNRLRLAMANRFAIVATLPFF